MTRQAALVTLASNRCKARARLERGKVSGFGYLEFFSRAVVKELNILNHNLEGLFREQQNFHEAGRLVHLVLAENIGLGLRSRLAFAAARIPARRVFDPRANRAAVGKVVRSALTCATLGFGVACRPL